MKTSRIGDVTSLMLYEPEIGKTYTLEETAGLTGVARRTIVLYSMQGLVSSATDPQTEGWSFDGGAIRILRRVEQLRTSCGANLASLRLILVLIEEIEQLRTRLRIRG